MNFALGLIATCMLNGFTGLPPKITGEVVISLDKYITIAVTNKDKTETVEMTFPKKMCTTKGK